MTITHTGSRSLGPDMSRPGWLGELALTNPRVAYSFAAPFYRDAVARGELIRPDFLGACELRCGWGWEILNLSACFTSGACGKTVPGIVCQIQGDLWVREVKYTVERPNAFAGNIFKGVSDYFNSLQPGIDFTLIIKSYCDYVISPDPTPLQNIEQIFSCVCPVGFVLGCRAQFEGRFTNKRVFAGDELPTEVTISFHGVRMPIPWELCGYRESIAALSKWGILQGVELPPEE